MWPICRRDLVQAFTTPLAWLVLACWTMLSNGLFVRTLHQVQGTSGSDAPLFVNAMALGVGILTLLAPAITMTAFSGERQQGTMQLLMTVARREHELVLGKFLAAWITLLSLVAATLIQPLVLMFVSQVNIPHLLSGYAGLVLICGFFAALGVWISLIVDTPIAAYVITFAVVGILFLIGLGGEDGPLGLIAGKIGLGPRVGPFFRGEIRLGNVVYFCGATAACLILAHGSLRARRIHG